ncbi:MAG: TIGR01841 family phasin [Alphaproteobacteria bacterium]|jgi:phasin family protein|nr:TIGR01841 family phasin [Alphaproteobacteria bacterium]
MADQSNPFKMFDFQSMFNNAKIPGLDVEAILAAQKKNVEAMIGANQIVAEGYQAVAKRQAELAQTTLQETQARVTDLMTDASPEGRMAKQAEMVKTGIEQASQSMHEVSEVLRKSQTEAFALIKRRMDESVDEIKEFKAA